MISRPIHSRLCLRDSLVGGRTCGTQGRSICRIVQRHAWRLCKQLRTSYLHERVYVGRHQHALVSDLLECHTFAFLGGHSLPDERVQEPEPNESGLVLSYRNETSRLECTRSQPLFIKFWSLLRMRNNFADLSPPRVVGAHSIDI